MLLCYGLFNKMCYLLYRIFYLKIFPKHNTLLIYFIKCSISILKRALLTTRRQRHDWVHFTKLKCKLKRLIRGLPAFFLTHNIFSTPTHSISLKIKKVYYPPINSVDLYVDLVGKKRYKLPIFHLSELNCCDSSS